MPRKDLENLSTHELENKNKFEENRLKSLFEYCVDLESPEYELDEITKLIALICKTPVASITLIDSNNIWLKSKTGFEEFEREGKNSEKAFSFFKQVIEQKEIFEVFDCNEDDKYKAHLDFTGYPNIRFYAGIPIVTPSGYNIGVLYVIDSQPRKLTQTQRAALATLAQHAMMFFELKKSKKLLEQANEVADKVTKAKDDFLSNISHEIRTPLNAIYGFTELLNKTILNKNQKEMLNIVKSSVEILMVIINDILDFSKIELGELEIKNTPFNLERAITSIKEVFTQKANEKNLELNFYIDKKLPKLIIGDKIRISQIITNLINNAIKFTNKGYIDFTVKLKDESEEKIEISFAVKDTGIGIEAEKLETIFERFQKADNETTRKYGGSGLGLSISKSLVEMQGGKLSIESEHGKGSVFSFALSLAKVNELKVQKCLKRQSKGGKVNKLVEEKRKFNEELKRIVKKDEIEVLILEDTIFNYILIEKIFENTLINLDYAENGKIGLKKLESKNYDMILLDLQMPEMDGFEFAHIVRSVKKSDILMLAISANNLGYEIQKCFEIGINDYFMKPFERKCLLDGIIRNFSNKAFNNLSKSVSYGYNNNNNSNNNSNFNSNDNSYLNNLSIISLQGSCNSITNTINNNHNNISQFNFNNNKCNENLDGSINFFFDDHYILKNDFNFTICSNSIPNSSKYEVKEGLAAESQEKNKGKRSKKRRKILKALKMNKSGEEDNQEKLKNINDSSIEKKINFLSEFAGCNNNENFIDESFKETDQSEEDLEVLRIIRKGNFIKFFINEEEYSSDLKVLEKNNNFKNSNSKICSYFLDTETEPEIIINTQQPDSTNCKSNFINNANTNNDNNSNSNKNDSNIICNKPNKKTEHTINSFNYNMSGFSTQDEILKEKKNNFSDYSIKDSFNNNIIKKLSLFQTHSLKTKPNDDINYHDLIEETRDLFDFSEQEKIEIQEINLNLNLHKLKSEKKLLSKSTEKDSICVSEQNSSFELNFSPKTNFEKSENNLIVKTGFKKLKSNFSFGEYEKTCNLNNESENSFKDNTREVRSDCFTRFKKRYCNTTKLNKFYKSKLIKQNYKNDKIELLYDLPDSFGKSKIIGSNCGSSKVYKKKSFTSSDEKEFLHSNSLLKQKDTTNFNNKPLPLNNMNDADFPNKNCVEASPIQMDIFSALCLKDDLVVDFSYFEEISDGDFDFQKELALIFLSETPIHIRNLKSACENFDFKEIHLITHSLKTSFNMLGVEKIKEIFLTMENLVKLIKDVKIPENEINNNNRYDNDNNTKFDEIKIKINNFSHWLKNEYPAVFSILEEKISWKYATTK